MIESTLEARIPLTHRRLWQNLGRELAGHGRVAIAYSGGVDSTFLAWFAKVVMRQDILAILVASPLVSARELAEARHTAQQLGFTLEELTLDVTRQPEVTANAPTRCYSCKKLILGEMRTLAQRLGYVALMDGTNADDLHQYRPGLRALQELGVISPLAGAGLSKAVIREFSRLGGLPTWNKPAQACLATRIPYGVSITSELLARIEKAEAHLVELGCRLVRVRVHDRLARIELEPGDFALLLDPAKRSDALHFLGKLGFDHVTLDLAGYRCGGSDL